MLYLAAIPLPDLPPAKLQTQLARWELLCEPLLDTSQNLYIRQFSRQGPALQARCQRALARLALLAAPVPLTTLCSGANGVIRCKPDNLSISISHSPAASFIAVFFGRASLIPALDAASCQCAPNFAALKNYLMKISGLKYFKLKECGDNRRIKIWTMFEALWKMNLEEALWAARNMKIASWSTYEAGEAQGENCKIFWKFIAIREHWLCIVAPRPIKTPSCSVWTSAANAEDFLMKKHGA